MSQIKKKFIADKAIDGSKILLQNNDALKALNAAGIEQSILKFSSDDALEFHVLPEFASDPVSGNQLTRKSYVDSKVSTEQSRAGSAESAIQGRLDTIEGADSVSGSVRKSLKDGKAYTDQEVLSEKTARESAASAEHSARLSAESALSGRINTEVSDRESAISSEQSARESAVSAEQSRAQGAESSLASRLNIVEGADSISGSVAKSLKDGKAYTDAAITSLVNGAPGVLDTLKELSDALAGDANFASTMASQLSSVTGRLGVIEGANTVSGSVLKSLKDSKDYTDSKFQESASNVAADLATEISARQSAVSSEASSRVSADNALGIRVDNEISARQSAMSSEQSARESADSGLSGRLNIVEGSDSVAGSVAKALKDAKAYSDSAMASEVSTRGSADSAMQGRLNIIEGAESQSGSTRKALKDAKDYTDAQMDIEQEARELQDNSMANRLDIIEDETGSVSGSVLKAKNDAKAYADSIMATEQSARSSAVTSEASARSSADSAMQGRLNIIEGSNSVSGSVLKALKDAKDYTDVQIGEEEVIRDAEVTALSERLDIVEGADNVEGSVAKVKKYAKDYADQKISDLVNSAPAVLDTLKELSDALGGDQNFAATMAGQMGALDGRLDIIEGADSVSGSVLKALKDAKAYTDTRESAEVSNRNAAILVEHDRAMAAESVLSSAISAEQSRAQGQEAAIETRFVNDEAASAAEIVRAMAAESALSGRITSEVSARQSAVSSEQSRAEGAESALSGRADVLEAVQHRKSKFVLSSGDIANQYVELSMQAAEKSTEVFVGPLYVHENDDYSVSVVAGKTRITFSGEIASGGLSEVMAGDVIYVKYMK